MLAEEVTARKKNTATKCGRTWRCSGARAHPVLYLGRHGHESLLDVAGSFRARFEERNF